MRTPMTPGDPRHGKLAGYRAGCHDDCCKAAINRYNNTRKLRALRGQPTSNLVPVKGTRRRLQALTRIGYTGPDLAARLGLTDQSYLNRITAARAGGPITHVTVDLARKIADLYDDLHDQPAPPSAGATRARSRAKRRGWQPPNAWHDIDRDETHIPDRERPQGTGIHAQVDPVVVDRILGGDPTPARTATPAERRAVVARCQTPHAPMSLTRLGDITGWNVDRYKARPAPTTSTTDDQETAA